MLSFLFSVPDAQKCCVHSLQYIFSYMLQQKKVFPSLDAFQLVPSRHVEEQGVFVRLDESTWNYCHLPRGFHIQCTTSSNTFFDSSCPCADHHALYDFLTELSPLCQLRHPKLARLFKILGKEKGSQSMANCAFCRHQSNSVDALLKAFQPHFPFLTRSTLTLFYRFPVREDADLQTLLKPHVTSMHYLFSQIRNPSIREQLVQEIYEAFLELEDEVETAVQDNDDEKMSASTKRFKSLIMDAIDRCCPFVQVRKIEFQRWLLTLVYFVSLQHTVPVDNQDALRLVKKTILLLHLYFHTPVVLTEKSVFYLQDVDESLRKISLDSDHFNKIHPAMRGDYIQV